MTPGPSTKRSDRVLVQTLRSHAFDSRLSLRERKRPLAATAYSKTSHLILYANQDKSHLVLVFLFAAFNQVRSSSPTTCAICCAKSDGLPTAPQQRAPRTPKTLVRRFDIFTALFTASERSRCPNRRLRPRLQGDSPRHTVARPRR